MKRVGVLLVVLITVTACALKNPETPMLNPATGAGYLAGMPLEAKAYILGHIKTIEEAIAAIRSYALINKDFNAVINDLRNVKNLINMLAERFSIDHATIVEELHLPGADQYLKLNNAFLSRWQSVKTVDDVVELLKKDVDINFLAGDSTPLTIIIDFAPRDKRLILLNYLLSLGARVNYVTPFGNTVLMDAVKTKNKEIVKAILDAGVNKYIINYHKDDNPTPLQVAAEGGNPTIVELLLKAGADAAIKLEGGRTAQDFVVEENPKSPAYAKMQEIVRLLNRALRTQEPKEE